MNYSLYIMVMETMSMESKGQGTAPVASSIISSQSIDLFRVFRIYLPPPSPHKFIEGVVYIVDFKSIRIGIAEQRGERAHKVKSEAHHTAKK
jgi:hypothetical protein